LCSEAADPARLIVCERTGDWAVVLRRELDDSTTRVAETRSLTECWQTLEESPASFVVVELTAGNSDSLLQRMGRLQRDFPLARIGVVAARDMARYEWLLREAGAVYFTCSPRQLTAIAEIACRHLAQSPKPERNLTDRVWASLPWQRRATR